jgi:hypothetical protein
MMQPTMESCLFAPSGVHSEGYVLRESPSFISMRSLASAGLFLLVTMKNHFPKLLVLACVLDTLDLTTRTIQTTGDWT